MAVRLHVPRVIVPKAANGIDEVVCAVARAWNNQACDRAARLFFGPSTLAERQDLIAEALYAFPDERDREFIARQLKEVADAIAGAVYPWTS
jgi:hypothetical protein